MLWLTIVTILAHKIKSRLYRTGRNSEIRCRFLVLACGYLPWTLELKIVKGPVWRCKTAHSHISQGVYVCCVVFLQNPFTLFHVQEDKEQEPNILKEEIAEVIKST